MTIDTNLGADTAQRFVNFDPTVLYLIGFIVVLGMLCGFVITVYSLYLSRRPAPPRPQAGGRSWRMPTFILTVLLLLPGTYFDETFTEPLVKDEVRTTQEIMSEQFCWPVFLDVQTASFIEWGQERGRIFKVPGESDGKAYGFPCISPEVSQIADPMNNHPLKYLLMDPLPDCPLNGYTCPELSREENEGQ